MYQIKIPFVQIEHSVADAEYFRAAHNPENDSSSISYLKIFYTFFSISFYVKRYVSACK